MKAFFFFITCLIVHGSSFSQNATPVIQRIDLTNWWVGMKNPALQLLVYGAGAGTLTYTINYPGVQLIKTSRVENPNYAFLDLKILSTARPGHFEITGKSGSLKNVSILKATST